jgi:hypothetical protein
MPSELRSHTDLSAIFNKMVQSLTGKAIDTVQASISRHCDVISRAEAAVGGDHRKPRLTGCAGAGPLRPP